MGGQTFVFVEDITDLEYGFMNSPKNYLHV